MLPCPAIFALPCHLPSPTTERMAQHISKHESVSFRDVDGPDDSSRELAYESIFGSNVPRRVLTTLDILSAGFNICNAWCGVAATLFLGFISGGPVTIIYGLLVATFVVGCAALSMAELAARYPTAGGQYHWTHILAPLSINRGVSYAAGILNIFAWQAIAASVCVIMPQLILGMAVYWHPNYVPQNYQSFLVFQATNLIVLAYNIGILQRARWTHRVGMFFSLLLGFSIFVACLAKASPKASSSTVWTTFVNEGTGWPSGVVFLTGMVNPNFGFIGIDGAVHLAEDALNAATAVPWALVAAVGVGFVTAFPFVVGMFYCISDPGAILESPLPIFGIFEQALQSASGATAMVSLIIFTGYFALIATQQTSSRLTWSFARDGGLIFSSKIGHVHQGLAVPVWALLVNAVVVFIMGCIYLGSQVAFNAIIGTSLILMHISIALPLLFLMTSGRPERYLPRKGHWNLGAFGWVVNFFAVAWAAVILVFYCFPTTNPTTGDAMNYASAVLGVFVLVALLNWFLYARKHYRGPTVDMAKLERLTERMS